MATIAFDGKNFSAASFKKFAKGTGREVFKEALKESKVLKDRLLNTDDIADKIIDNLDKKVRVSEYTQDQQVVIGSEIVRNIHEEFLGLQTPRDTYGSNSKESKFFSRGHSLEVSKSLHHIKTKYDPSRSLFRAEYGAKYLHRNSLIRPGSDGQPATGAGKYIGRGLDDIYAYYIHEYEAKPAYGWWVNPETKRRRWVSRWDNAHGATEFVYAGFSDYIEDKQHNIIITIPRKWTNQKTNKFSSRSFAAQVREASSSGSGAIHTASTGLSGF